MSLSSRVLLISIGVYPPVYLCLTYLSVRRASFGLVRDKLLTAEEEKRNEGKVSISSTYAGYAPCPAPPSAPLSRQRRVTAENNDGLVAPTPFNGEKQIGNGQFPGGGLPEPPATRGSIL